MFTVGKENSMMLQTRERPRCKIFVFRTFSHNKAPLYTYIFFEHFNNLLEHSAYIDATY